MRRMLGKSLKLSSIGIIALIAAQANAAGYRVSVQDAAVFASSGEAEIINASTNWYNSAGLVLIPQQLTVSGFDVYVPTRISGTAIAPSLIPPSPLIPVPPPAYVVTGKASSHTNVQLPSIHYALPLDANWAVGLSVVPAWGLAEDFGTDSFIRYNAERIYTKTLDIAPSVAWRMNQNWSFGLGPDFHYFSLINNFALNTFVPGLFGDARDHLSADSWEYGFHVGVLYQVNPCIRIGLNYRGQFVNHLEGHSVFDGVTANLPPSPLSPNFVESDQFRFRLRFPPVTTLAAYWAVTPQLAVMGNIYYEQWSVNKAYYATGVATPRGLVNVTLEQGFSNTFDFGLGAKYTLSDQILLRGTVVYVQTPTTTAHREPVFPDASKWGIHVGGHYQYNYNLGFDAVYAHVWFKNVGIHAVNHLTGATTSGTARTRADIFGVGMVWTVC